MSKKKKKLKKSLRKRLAMHKKKFGVQADRLNTLLKETVSDIAEVIHRLEKL